MLKFLQHLLKSTLITGVILMSFFSSNKADAATNAYHFTFRALGSGKELPLAQFKGKVLLVVNTASECGFTPQYAGLERLYQEYKDQGLVVLGVPSNDFGKQEPGTSQEIATFCQANYGVTFPLTEKEVVKGSNAHPFYLWAKQHFGILGAPKWNFHKYLIDRNGNLVTYFHSNTEPESSSITSEIERLLNEQVEQ